MTAYYNEIDPYAAQWLRNLIAAGLIADGGRLASIMSPHWTFAENAIAQGFRDFVAKHGGGWSELPAGSFSGSGTGVNTGILVLER